MMKLKNLVFALTIVGVASVSSTTFAGVKTIDQSYLQKQCLFAAERTYDRCKISSLFGSKTLAQCDSDKKVAISNCGKSHQK